MKTLKAGNKISKKNRIIYTLLVLFFAGSFILSSEDKVKKKKNWFRNLLSKTARSNQQRAEVEPKTDKYAYAEKILGESQEKYGNKEQNDLTKKITNLASRNYQQGGNIRNQKMKEKDQKIKSK
eukprot:TRINITY_DN35730_c0_g1_i1.p1 TRINITY_DN35730_c0_g1~~TRINITY_DN35730_c0_g1_i1.p1  ORF type:complete len:124 (+),score=7.74 TRINITY_DN35730_c0_g1_i1:13-384(+)